MELPFKANEVKKGKNSVKFTGEWCGLAMHSSWQSRMVSGVRGHTLAFAFLLVALHFHPFGRAQGKNKPGNEV